MKHSLIALFSTVAITSGAHAIEFTQVQPSKSQITFDYQQMGVTVEGKFNQFVSWLSFDPAVPASAKARIEVDLASVDTGSDEGDTEVAGKTWFNLKAFPVARFESTSVTPRGGNKYDIAGKLTIKGTTRDVLLPTTFTQKGKTGVFDGRLVIRRGNFSIGEGAWRSFDIVANDVLIKFRITAVAGR